MLVKQYVVTLPADYDMTIIRRRVAAKGPAFDGFPGLGLKCFMIRERGRFGAPGNEYAPVYCWPQMEPMWSFIAGAGFRGITDSFGWPPIRIWPGLCFRRAPAGRPLGDIRSVSRLESSVQPGADLAVVRQRELADADNAAANMPGLVARAVGLNPQSWSLVRFDYWSLPQESLAADVPSFEVLHVSSPNPDGLRGAQ